MPAPSKFSLHKAKYDTFRTSGGEVSPFVKVDIIRLAEASASSFERMGMTLEQMRDFMATLRISESEDTIEAIRMAIPEIDFEGSVAMDAVIGYVEGKDVDAFDVGEVLRNAGIENPIEFRTFRLGNKLWFAAIP